MTISRSLMERQLRADGGIMTLEEPRQGYFLGKLVRKAKRAVKKVVKSPIGKAALLGAGAMYAGGLGPFASGSSMFGGKLAGLKGAGFLRGTGSGILSGLTGGGDGFLGQIGNVFRVGGDADNKFSALRLLGGGLGAAAIAAPFLMGGDEEEVVEDTPFSETPESIANIVNQARNRDSSLRFLPKPKFVDNFYAADGGLARTGYNMGGPTDGGVMMASNMQNDSILQNLYEKFLDSGMSPKDAEEAARKLFERMSQQQMNTPRTEAAGGGIMAAKRGFVDGPGGYAGKKGKSKKPNMAEMTQFEENIPMYIGGQVLPFLPYLMAMKDGGRIPAQEGGLMDLGGLEKDYREGGFVPLGAEERADDVPARLSKNEFVFTADAVRNAGGGDIDKGAEVMQNMMDNLEAGGTISEESQGEENPAQEMFDQAQQLESRIA